MKQNAKVFITKRGKLEIYKHIGRFINWEEIRLVADDDSTTFEPIVTMDRKKEITWESSVPKE